MTIENKAVNPLKTEAAPNIKKDTKKLSEQTFTFKQKKDGIAASIDKAESDNPEEKILQELCKSFGTNNKDVLNNLLMCVSNIYGDKYTDDNLTFVANFIRELKPKDALETMLISQMLAVHNMTMRSFYRANLPEQTSYGVEANIDRAIKFSRTYLAQMEALKKYRSKSNQKNYS